MKSQRKLWPMGSNRIWCPVLLVLVAIAQSGCSSDDEAKMRIGRSITQAQTAIEVASSESTKEHAGGDLSMAAQKLIQAEEAARAGNYERAERLISESRVNVTLATARTHAAEVQEKIQAAGGTPPNAPQRDAGTQ